MIDLLIQNAEIADGSGQPSFFGDIAVKDGRIIEICRREQSQNSDNSSGEGLTINAEGLTVVPGFIDIHRHGDLSPFGSGEEAEELRQGISFFINGSCGFSTVPSRAEFFDVLQNYARPIMGGIPPKLCGAKFAGLRRELEQQLLYSSMGYLCGGGALRIAVKGLDNSPMSASEMDCLLGLLNDELDAGTFGLSLGLMYAPECFYSLEELVKICRVPAKRNRPVTVHMWQEGNGLTDSIEKIISLARQSGAAFHISHLKVTGKRNHGTISKTLARIACAQQEMDITFDVYPYNAGSTALYALLPPVFLNRGLAVLLGSLRKPETRKAITAELQNENAAWDNVVSGNGWQSIVIAGGRDHSLIGRSVEEIAAQRGCSSDDCAFDLLLENEGNITVIIFSMSMDDVEQILKTPGAIVISDSIYAEGGFPHPRRFGAQARFLSGYADVLGFEKALCSVTSLPARRFGLKDRGLLQAGAIADIVLLDRRRFRDTSVWENPVQYPQGIAEVFIAGKPAFREQEGPLGKFGRLSICEK
ncbi:MAG: amidohydrolase family protein [Treponema sp.]|jgi:N-acyl-D-aspartate/D-glutamate deacylase|nr:amidohydrolase family protein [Treponema sp.]